jgi:probable HAF family extracellular repeat protein
LGTLPGKYASGSRDINNSGQVVGIVVMDATNSTNSIHAVLFDPTGNGNNTDLGTLGGLESEPYVINDAGQVVGYAMNAPGYERAALFDTSGKGKSRDLGVLGNNLSSQALGINNLGQIVGHSGTNGVLFDSSGNGNNKDLGNLDGQNSYAMFINDQGLIAGITTTSTGETRATRFDTTGQGKNIDLGSLSGEKICEITGLNNKGQIIGFVKRTFDNDYSDPEDFRPVLFDPTGSGKNTDLNDLIDKQSGWILYSASDVNDKGWIVGIGKGPDGNYRGFLLTPQP